MSTTAMMPLCETWKQRALDLKLHGLITHWDLLGESDTDWVQRLIDWEEKGRNQRGLERRLRLSRLRNVSTSNGQYFSK